jgi:hypothetical protein
MWAHQERQKNLQMKPISEFHSRWLPQPGLRNSWTHRLLGVSSSLDPMQLRFRNTNHPTWVRTF